MNNIVLVGAGGTGMSGVAGLLQDLGFKNLICIDSTQSELTDKLKEKGIKTVIGHGIYKINPDDIVIYSAATEGSPEVQAASTPLNNTKPRPKGFKLNYFQFLGEISKYFQTIGFAGTNGKSTSSALGIYTAQKLLPNFGLGILGSLVPDFEGNSYTFNQKIKSDIKNIFEYIFVGKGLNYDNVKKYLFFVEACEYKRHFLNLDLDYSIITNIELDHTDYYKDMDDYKSAFEELINKTKKEIITTKTTCRDADLSRLKGIEIHDFNFKHIFGKHNDQNGSLILELMRKLGCKDAISCVQTIENFGGLQRRLELMTTTKNGTIIYSDYAHMASSIKTCYDSIKEKYPDKKIVAIFQPHQTDRVLRERDQFKTALENFDETIIYDIYSARENIENIEELGNKFAENCGGKYITNSQKIIEKINNFDNQTICTIFTAGDLDYHIRNHFLKN